MKGFFTWFKSSTKIKRWMLLILIGIILSCIGFSEILVQKEMDFLEVAKIIGIFVIGFTCVVIGIVYIQKRTLELVVESEQKEDVDIKSLIFNKNVYEKGPNVVVIGGGSGLNTVLKGLKNYTSNITAIVTISDYGKKASDSRTQLHLLPLDDIKSSLVALANNDIVMDKLLNYQFAEDRLKKLSFGDIYLSAMRDIYGDFTESIERSSEVLNITGKVLPVTLDAFSICAELKDGTVVEEKSKIPEIVSKKVTKINRIYINPSNCKPAPGIIEAIESADAIIIGPGSLYTNVIPNLLVKGVAKTIKESKALKIYVSNIMTEPGQTDNYTLTDHLDAILEHAGAGIVDFCICDTGEIVPEFVRRYNLQGSDIVEPDITKANSKGIKIIQKNMSYIQGEYIRHNPDVIASSIIELVCNDLRYRDRQADPEYLYINSKLKTEKRNQKEQHKTKKVEEKQKRKHEVKVEPKGGKRRKSKFQEKYEDRIHAIKHSDEITKKNKNDFEETQKKQQRRNKKKK